MTVFKYLPTPGSLYAGQLAGGALLAALGLFSRIRRWAMSATGARVNTTHGKEGPPAQPNPVDGLPVYALLRRADGQMKPLEIRIPADTPAKRMLRAAYWEIWSHPEIEAFEGVLSVEQVSFRPEDNCHLNTPADALVYDHNKRSACTGTILARGDQ